MGFLLWLEEVEKNHEWWKRFFLGIWSLHGSDGLGKNLLGFDMNRLVGTSEFQALSPNQKSMIQNKVTSGNGTVGDLVDIASGTNQGVFQPSQTVMGIG
jgi:hypothetical protein